MKGSISVVWPWTSADVAVAVVAGCVCEAMVVAAAVVVAGIETVCIVSVVGSHSAMIAYDLIV